MKTATEILKYVTVLRSRLARLPKVGALPGGLGESVYTPKHTDAEISTVLQACAPAKLGTEDAAVRMACWVSVLDQMLLEMALIAEQQKSLVAGLRAAALTPGPFTAAYSSAHEAALGLQKKMEQELAFFRTLVAGLHKSLRAVQENKASAEALDDPEVFAQQDDLTLSILLQVGIPVVDQLMTQLAIFRAARAIIDEGVQTDPQRIQRSTDGWKRLMDELNLQAKQSSSIFEDLMSFLFGKEPFKKLAVGIGAVVVGAVAVMGGLYLAAKVYRKAVDEAKGPRKPPSRQLPADDDYLPSESYVDQPYDYRRQPSARTRRRRSPSRPSLNAAPQLLY